MIAPAMTAGLPLRFASLHFPLTRFHKRALPAAVAAEAAAKQGKFWPMYQNLFAGTTTELSDRFIEE